MSTHDRLFSDEDTITIGNLKLPNEDCLIKAIQFVLDDQTDFYYTLTFSDHESRIQTSKSVKGKLVHSEDNLKDIRSRYSQMLQGLSLLGPDFNFLQLGIASSRNLNLLKFKFIGPDGRIQEFRYADHSVPPHLITDEFLHDLSTFPKRFSKSL